MKRGLLLSPKKEERMVRWARLFDMYATRDQRIQFDRMHREDQYVFMRDTVLSELEKLATNTRGKLLARILSFLTEEEVRQICTLSTVIYEVCKQFKLKERFLVGVAFMGHRRLNVPRPVVSVAIGLSFSVFVTDEGSMYGEGIFNNQFRSMHRLPPIGEAVEYAVCGSDHCLFVTRLTRRAFGFMSNARGQLGIGGGGMNYVDVPQQVLIAERVGKISCGRAHTAVLTQTGNLYLFGDGTHFKAGDDLRHRHRVFHPLLLYFQDGVLDVSLGQEATIVLTGAREVRKYGIFNFTDDEMGDGQVLWTDEAGDIATIHCGTNGVLYIDVAGNLMDGNRRIAENVVDFKAPNNWLTVDGTLFMNGNEFPTPLPVSQFDGAFYVLSGANLEDISMKCVQCGRVATHVAADTHEAYCEDLICLPKRLRDDDELEEAPQGFSRARQDDPNVLHATTQAILDNPRRLEAFANQLSREEIVAISKSDGNDFYSQLNRNNAFWYLISKRFIGVGFNRLVNYKDIAGRLTGY